MARNIKIHVAVSASGDVAIATTDETYANQMADIRNKAAGQELYAVISPMFNLDVAAKLVQKKILKE